MEEALIVSSSEKARAYLKSMLAPFAMDSCCAASAGEARRAALDRQFAIAIINAPLQDELGHELASEMSLSGVGVLLLIKADLAEELAAAATADGVCVLGKPLSRESLWQSLRLMLSLNARVYKLAQENDKLRRKLEDERLIARAKMALIQHRGMTEAQAHRHIEKTAMERRTTRREVALTLLEDLNR